MNYRNKEQLIVHYSSINKVNENDFKDSPDPIVIYKKSDKTEYVKVLPFKNTHSDKENLSFNEKIQYYKRIPRDTRTNTIKTNLIQTEDFDVVRKFRSDLGTFEDFVDSYNSPDITGLNSTMANYFDSYFLDFDTGAYNEFQTAYNSAKGA